MSDIESDYWKEILMHLQHRNMCRLNAERLLFSDAKNVINEFCQKHSELESHLEDKELFITWEFFVTEKIKFRLFIQLQIKASLMQENKGEWVKIADAKFPNNPFPEIELLLSNRDKYKNDLNEQIKESQINNVQTKVSVELIKAMLMNKFSLEYTSLIVNPQEELYKVEIIQGENKKAFTLTKENFLQEVKAL